MRALLFTFALLFIMVHTNAQETRSAEEANGLAVGLNAPDFQAVDADSDILQGSLVSYL